MMAAAVGLVIGHLAVLAAREIPASRTMVAVVVAVVTPAPAEQARISAVVAAVAAATVEQAEWEMAVAAAVDWTLETELPVAPIILLQTLGGLVMVLVALVQTLL